MSVSGRVCGDGRRWSAAAATYRKTECVWNDDGGEVAERREMLSFFLEGQRSAGLLVSFDVLARQVVALIAARPTSCSWPEWAAPFSRRLPSPDPSWGASGLFSRPVVLRFLFLDRAIWISDCSALARGPRGCFCAAERRRGRQSGAAAIVVATALNHLRWGFASRLGPSAASGVGCGLTNTPALGRIVTSRHQ